MMSLLLAVAALILFDVIVALWGHDSRDGRDWSGTGTSSGGASHG